MKAFIHTRFGSPEHLKLEERPVPDPKDSEVRVRIQNCAINSWDVDIVHGKPFAFRPLFGIFTPKHPVIGIDMSGTVDAIGDQVTDFSVGDRVFGDLSSTGFGCFAEFVCTDQKYLAKIPESIDFVTGSSVPHAGLLAWQGLHWKGDVGPGDQVLINGAAGGVGSIAIQLCKHWGALVTCVDREDKLGFLNELGASEYYDYKKTNFSELDRQFDLIIDPVADKKANDYAKVLKPGGRLVMIGGKVSSMISLLLRGKRLNKKLGIKMGMLGYQPNRLDLEKLTQAITDGWLEPRIQKVYDFEQIPEALTELANGNSFGKLVIQVAKKK